MSMRSLLGRRDADRTPDTIDAVADIDGVARRFAAEVGVGPHAYLTQLRMQEAARLLRESDDSMARTASSLSSAAAVAAAAEAAAGCVGT